MVDFGSLVVGILPEYTVSVPADIHLYLFIHTEQAMVDFEQWGSLKDVLKLSSAQQAAILGSPFLKIGCFALSENRASVRCVVFGTWNHYLSLDRRTKGKQK